MIITIPGFKPFRFQNDAVLTHISQILQNNGTCIFDDTGLGKTITAATTAINCTLGEILIISPTANTAAWKEVMNASSANYKVCTSVKIIPGSYSLVIVDEAHNFRNIKSKSYRELFIIIKQNQAKVILISATPFQNKVSELKTCVSLIHFNTDTAAFTLLGPLFAEIKKHEVVIERMEQYKGTIEDPKGDGLSFRDIGNNVEAKWKLESAFRQLSATFGTFSNRNTRESITAQYKDDVELMGHFPHRHELKLEYGRDFGKIFHETVDIINNTPMALQNIAHYDSERNDNVLFSMGGIMRSFLLKRLDSSVYAFKISLRNALEKALNVLCQYEDTPEIFIDNEAVYVKDQFWKDLPKDIKNFEYLIDLWEHYDDHGKLELLFSQLNGERCVVFTEYKDTLDLIYTEAKFRRIKGIKEFSGTSTEKELEQVRNNFDANLESLSDDIMYLFTTDVLAEGVNLHAARRIIHFDQKWNPSRTKQRNGRIDRIMRTGVSSDITIISFEVESLVERILNLEKSINKKQYLGDMFIENLYAPTFPKLKEFEKDAVYLFPGADFKECYDVYRTAQGDVMIKGGFFTTLRQTPVIEVEYDFNPNKAFLKYKRSNTIHPIRQRLNLPQKYMVNEITNMLYAETYDMIIKFWLQEMVDFQTTLECVYKILRVNERAPYQTCTVWLKENQYMNWE